MKRTNEMNKLLALIERNKQGKRDCVEKMEREERRLGHKLRGGAKAFYNMVIRGYDERIDHLRSCLKKEMVEAR